MDIIADAHTVSQTIHFIPLPVYPKDKKPAFHHHSHCKDVSITVPTTLDMSV